MNIRVLMTYSKYLLLIGVVWALASCQREDKPLDVPEDGTPIEVAVAIDDSNITKTDSYPLDLFLGKDFVVWGSWIQDPLDNLPYSGDYASGSTNKVFGEYGTRVYAVNGNGDPHFTPTVSSTNDKWSYQPTRFWYRGVYMFAGAAPATLFNSSYSSEGNVANVGVSRGTYTGSATFANNGTVSYTTEKLTINFGSDGYDLSVNQDDIMTAFDEEDNRNENAQGVNFTFKHQLSLVNIKAASMESRTNIRIDEITVYGNKSKATSLVATPAASVFTLIENTKTTSSSPYKTFEGPWELTPKDASTDPTYHTIVDGMLVFPEQVGEFNVVVKYTDCYNDSEVTMTKSGTLSSVKWESGKKYTYTFTISLDGIVFGDISVEEWPTTSESFDNIEM